MTRQFGVTSLVVDHEDNKVWSMCRNGMVYSYRLASPKDGVVDQFYSEDLKVSSFYCKLAVVNPTQNNVGAYIACAGENGIVLFSKPCSPEPSFSTNSVLLQNGHSKEVTGLCFHPQSGTLMSTSDDATVRFWEPNRELYVKLRDQALANISNTPATDWAGWSTIV
jgi:WD40 repeat protein